MNASARAPSPPSYLVLFGSLLIVGAGNSMLQPLLPPLARELGLPDSSLGWIFSLSALFWVFASPFWGRRSDDVGRRPIIALGMAAYALSMALFALVVVVGLFGWLNGLAVFAGLILSRSIFGAVGSASNPAAQAYVADYTEPAKRTEQIAALAAAFGVGSIAGPFLCAGLAAVFGLVFPIVLTSVLAALAAISIWFVLREPRKPPQSAERGSWKDSWRLAADARLAAFLIYGLGLSTVTGTLQQTYTLYVMDKLGVRGEQAAGLAAWGFFVGALAAVGTQLLLIPALKWKSRTFMTVGAAVILGGAVAQMLASGFVGLIVSQLVQGVGSGLARSGFAGGSSMAVRPDEQGAAAGLVVAASGAGYVISPVSGGVAYDYADENAPLIICAAVLAAMAVFAWRSRRLRNAG